MPFLEEAYATHALPPARVLVKRAAVRAQILCQASAPRASSRTRYSLTHARAWAHASVLARLHLHIATI
jgi:hypothetical protein